MQKKLLALAVTGALAAPGAALAQVEVYGFISVAVNKFKYSSSTAGDPSVSKWDVSSHGSNYGVRGREDIGGGQTAWFQIEQNAPMERSNNVAITPASRNTAVGVQGNWGNFFIGQWTTPWADLESLWSIGSVGGYSPSLSIIGRRETTGTAPNPNCANGHLSGGQGFITGATTSGAGTVVTSTVAICDAVEGGGGVGHPFWRRISQAIFYYSPVFGGAQAKFAYQTNEGKATAAPATVVDPSMWSASIQWSGMGGRARVGAAYDAHKDFTTPGQTDNGWTVKGGYNFGVVDVGLAYEQMTYKIAAGDCDAVQWGAALAIPIGQGAIRASYAVADDLDGPATCVPANPALSGAGDNGAKMWTLGYDHRFSKRTQIGFGYAIIQNDAAASFTWTGAPPAQNGATNAPPAGSDPSTFFVSVVHRF
jgi:predicted porin